MSIGKKLISFDFDDTIGMLNCDDATDEVWIDFDGSYVQTPNEKIIATINGYVKDGHDVICVTARPEKYLDDVYGKLKKWKVPIETVYCTNLQKKAPMLKHLGVHMHYDNDIEEIKALDYTPVIGILVR